MRERCSNFPEVLIRARAMTGFAALVASHGGDAGALLEGVGIPAHLLDNPDTPLPLARFATLLADAAKQLNLPDFGLRLAQQQDISVLGPVALFARHAATVGEACRAMARNLPYHSPGVQVTVEQDPLRPGYSQLRCEVNPGVDMPRRQAIELCLGVAQRFLLTVTGDAGADWHVSFRHSSALAPARYGQHFCGTVRLEQEFNTLSLPTRLFELALAPDNAVLSSAAERYISNVIRRFPLDIAQQVEALIERDLAGGGGGLVQIARQLGLHERTLQRRLKEQSVFFEDIVDRLRRTRAEEFLSYPAIPLAQVGALLGYTEQSSFIRVCKRWFTTTPQSYRARCLSERAVK